MGLYPDGLQHSLLVVVEVVREHGIAGLLCKLAQEIGEIGLGERETACQSHSPGKSCCFHVPGDITCTKEDTRIEGNRKEWCRRRRGIRGKGWSRGKRVGTQGRAHQQLQVVGKAGMKVNRGAEWVGASPGGIYNSVTLSNLLLTSASSCGAHG